MEALANTLLEFKMENNVKNQFSRIRASWLFFVKINFGILAAFVTIASILKFNLDKIIEIASNYNSLITYLGFLIVYGLIGEYFLSAEWSESDSDGLLFIKLKISKGALFVFVLLTAGILLYILGTINEYLDTYAKK